MELEAGGTVWRVEARRLGDRWRVTVDGREFEVAAVRAGPRWSLLVGPAGGTGSLRSAEVSVEDRGGGQYAAVIDGREVLLASAPARASPTKVAEAGRHKIAAPMPGRIVKVLVRPGDAVTARQALVVVEAMKMENELRAPAAGTVTEVAVAEGALVEARTVLVVIEG